MSTEKPNPLRGYRETQETKRDMPVDPKRFQEELNKVQESDEAQKRQQRNLKKTEEESDEEIEDAPIEASGDLFAGFMDESEKTSVMNPQTPQNLRSTQGPTTSSSFTIEEDGPTPYATQGTSKPSGEPLLEGMPTGGIPAPSISAMSDSMGEDQFTSDQAPFITVPESFQETIPASSPQQTSASTQETKPQEVSSTSETKSPQRVQKKTHQDTSLLSKKAPSVAQMLKKEEKPSVPIKLQQGASTQTAPEQKKIAEPPKTPSLGKPQVAAPAQPLPTKAPLPAATVEKQVHLSQSLPSTLNSQGTPAKDQRSQPSEGRVSAQEQVKQATSTQSDTSGDHSSKKDEKKESDQATSVSGAVPLTPFHVPEPTAPSPAYTTLSPQVYELFEKMVGFMTIEMGKGVTTTTVTINMKDSIFNGAKIVIDHYSTAPNAFNITIAGSPEAQELVNNNLGNLAAAFEQSKLSFQVNLRRPVLLEEHQAIQRKGKAGEEESGGQKKKK